MSDNKREVNAGNGLRVTESDDMGIFLHFENKAGKQSGMKIDVNNFLYQWALELLDEAD